MSTTSRKLILVVDDAPDVRESLALLLGLVGFEVATAADGGEALNYLRSHRPPCLIVLDLRMPGMNGRQFRDEQRRDPVLSRIPVVVSSAEASTGGTEALGTSSASVPRRPTRWPWSASCGGTALDSAKRILNTK